MMLHPRKTNIIKSISKVKELIDIELTWMTRIYTNEMWVTKMNRKVISCRSTVWKNKFSIDSWKQRPSLPLSNQYSVNRSTCRCSARKFSTTILLVFGTTNIDRYVFFSDEVIDLHWHKLEAWLERDLSQSKMVASRSTKINLHVNNIHFYDGVRYFYIWICIIIC